jgi:hypothetical protein
VKLIWRMFLPLQMNVCAIGFFNELPPLLHNLRAKVWIPGPEIQTLASLILNLQLYLIVLALARNRDPMCVLARLVWRRFLPLQTKAHAIGFFNELLPLIHHLRAQVWILRPEILNLASRIVNLQF